MTYTTQTPIAQLKKTAAELKLYGLLGTGMNWVIRYRTGWYFCSTGKMSARNEACSGASVMQNRLVQTTG